MTIHQIGPVFSFKVSGDLALFTDPIMKLGGEKLSYSIPTYQALKGIAESIYWKPTFMIVIDRVRIMNKIQFVSKSIRLRKYDKKITDTDLARYTYLKDVNYQVLAHLEFNQHRLDLKPDWNVGKHLAIMNRAIDRGGRRGVFLGTSECFAYVEPCVFNTEPGYYDQADDISYGTMLHGFNYPDETGRDQLETRLWNPVMHNGIIDFIRPDQCPVVVTLHQESAKSFELRKTLQPVDQTHAEVFK